MKKESSIEYSHQHNDEEKKVSPEVLEDRDMSLGGPRKEPCPCPLSAAVVQGLECPVCLSLPRGPPIVSCSRGHSLCRDCHRRLSRGRCPVCLSGFSRPPARNFLAESLLEEVARPCSWHHLGCTVTSWGSPQLAEHEETCRHREKPGQGREDSQEASLPSLLASVVRSTVLFFLVASPYILSYVLYQYVVYGSFQLCCLPPYLLPSSSGLQDPALGGTFAVFRGLEEVLLLPALGLFSSLVRLAQEPAVCLPSTTVSLYWHWPDTFLPAHLDSMVWRPQLADLVNDSIVLDWLLSNDTFTMGEETRYGQTLPVAELESFMQWKMELPPPLRVCSLHLSYREGLGEPWHLVRLWGSPLLQSTGELMVLAAVTEWKGSCNAREEGSLRWRVNTQGRGIEAECPIPT